MFIRWLDDTWFFNGSSWQFLAGPPASSTADTSTFWSGPCARYGHTLNLVESLRVNDDQQHLNFILFGGDNGGVWLTPNHYSPSVHVDVWLLSVALSRNDRGYRAMESSVWRQIEPRTVDGIERTSMPAARQAHGAFISKGCLVRFLMFEGVTRRRHCSTSLHILKL